MPKAAYLYNAAHYPEPHCSWTIPMIIALGSDHAGYEAPEPPYKNALFDYLVDLGHEPLDCGVHAPGPADYPDIAAEVCRAVLDGHADAGILLCGTGMGMSIAANRYPGIRAAVPTTVEMARLAREHNDANILCLGRRTLTLAQCQDVVRVWLTTPFSQGDRHRRRIRKIERHEWIDAQTNRC